MSEQYCPNCDKKSFIWALDEDNSPLTQWHCSLCDFHAEENEMVESLCDNCGTKHNLYLKSVNGYFRFCTNCKEKSEALPW